MRKHSWWSVGLLCGVFVLTACEAINETPSATPSNEAVLSLPTRTVKPIVSFTPRFTATPIPSLTPTPSITPIPTSTFIPPTATYTPIPTATPTVEGVIQSTQRVNLREGPGTEAAIVRSVESGTRLGILSIQTDAKGLEWYEVAYTNDQGEVERLWVRANLVVTDFAETVAAVASGTPVKGSSSGTPPATPEPNRINILAYCEQKGVRPASPTTNDKVYIEWSWYVARAELMDQHLAHANYQVELDGRLLENWQNYATEMKQEAGVWIVYWYYPIGKMEAGEHTVTFTLTWDEAITDGYQQFGPGTANETDRGGCTFTVNEP